MRDRYTMRELTAMLNADGNTVRSWLDALGIEPSVDRYDARRKWVTAEEAQIVAEEHARTLLPLPDDMPSTLPAAHRRIAQLMSEVARLRGEIAKTATTEVQIVRRDPASVPPRPRAAPLYPADVNAAPPTTRSRPVAVEQTRSRQPGQIGIGIRFAAQIAMNHGANSWGAARDWNWPTADLVSETTALAFIKHYLTEHPRSGTWRPFCERTACPCYGVTAAPTATHDEERDESALLEDRNDELA